MKPCPDCERMREALSRAQDANLSVQEAVEYGHEATALAVLRKMYADGKAALSPRPEPEKPCPTCQDGGGCVDCWKGEVT